MTDYTEKKCPKCGQQLRFPKDIGGMLMACPSCGKKFHSDFKLGGIKRSSYHGILINVFEMPSKIMTRIGRFFSSKDQS
jgi:DNA-directed RNA polymerase subunit RPC12/RpoP